MNNTGKRPRRQPGTRFATALGDILAPRGAAADLVAAAKKAKLRAVTKSTLSRWRSGHARPALATLPGFLALFQLADADRLLLAWVLDFAPAPYEELLRSRLQPPLHGTADTLSAAIARIHLAAQGSPAVAQFIHTYADTLPADTDKKKPKNTP